MGNLSAELRGMILRWWFLLIMRRTGGLHIVGKYNSNPRCPAQNAGGLVWEGWLMSGYIMPTNLPTNALKWGEIGGEGGGAVGMGKL